MACQPPASSNSYTSMFLGLIVGVAAALLIDSDLHDSNYTKLTDCQKQYNEKCVLEAVPQSVHDLEK